MSRDDPNSQTGEFLTDSLNIKRIQGQNLQDKSRAEAMPPSSLPRDWTQRLNSPPPHRGGSSVSLDKLPEGAAPLILQITRDLVVEDGHFNDITLERIADRAGLTGNRREAFFQVFESGDVVSSALVEQFFSPFFGQVSGAIFAPTSILETLRDLGSRWMEHLLSDVAFYVICSAYLRHPNPDKVPELVDQTIRAITKRRVGVIAGFLAEGQLRGDVCEGDPMQLAYIVDGFTYGVLAMASNSTRLDKAGLYAREVVAESFEMIYRGLKKT